ncbi:alcohol dehydrogenase [Sulfolobus sp. F3]|nr:alcohol dehydrogenase [Sulfolobus sp. F3]
MKGIIFNLGITKAELSERELNKDFVALTPFRVLIDGIENAIYVGLLWVEPGRILGSIGLGRITNVGLDIDKSLEVKLVLVLPYSQTYGGIGTEIDGVLCEKANVPFDSIVVIPQSEFNEKFLLYPYVSFALQLPAIITSGSTLIVGGGLYGTISALYLKNYVSKVSIYREDGINPKLIGVEEVKELSNDWDNVIIATYRSWIRAFIDVFSKSNTKIVMPRILNTWPIISSHKVHYIQPKEMDGVLDFIKTKISNKLFEELISFSDNIETSLPVPKAGVIINTEKLFKH